MISKAAPMKVRKISGLLICIYDLSGPAVFLLLICATGCPVKFLQTSRWECPFFLSLIILPMKFRKLKVNAVTVNA